MLAVALDPTIAVAVVAGTLALVSTVVSLRARGYPDLVEDLMDDRRQLRAEVEAEHAARAVLVAEVSSLRGEVDGMKLHQQETEAALLRCRQAEIEARQEIAALRRLVAGP